MTMEPNAPNWALPAQQQPQTGAPQQAQMAQPHPQQQAYLSQQQQLLQQQQQAYPAAQTTLPNVATPTVTPSPSAGTPQVSNKNNRMARMEDKVLVTLSKNEEFEDGRILNKEAMAKIRDAWVYKQVRARSGEFTEYKQASLFCGTWNVNAKGKEESLEGFICSDWGHDGRHAPDIVAVGFQEIVDLNAVNVAVETKTTQRSQFWVDRLQGTLNAPRRNQSTPQQGYVLLTQRSMVGLLICVFVKGLHRHRVKAIAEDSVGVGVMGMLGNKGGVGIRIQFYDSTICFVNSHLAAHRENVEGRNADFLNVAEKLSFEVGEEVVREVIRNGSMSQWAAGSSSVSMADHDLVFWLGDLNYRIDESLSTEKVLELAEKRAIHKLRPLDQLNIERREGRVFSGFVEGTINFAPTYKYQPGTDVYEKRPEKKLRAPAWCDRILWMAQEPNQVQQWNYKRSETPNVSDHKPVYSIFGITFKDVVVARREAIYRELFALLDRFQNQSLPKIGLDVCELKFGQVRYEQAVTMPIRITNTGNVCAQFRFIPKLDENSLCKPWMTVSPTYGMLIPGEPTATINVTITIDNNTAQLLNSRRDVLEDVLILRLENGRDYYIPISGNYARSCFGMGLDELVLYKDPIRTIPLDAVERSEQFTNDLEISPTNALCVPKELWRVVDAIYEKGLQTPDIFNKSGVPEEVYQIRECLDTEASFGPFSIHSYIQLLLSFLSKLSTPIVPNAFLPTVEINAENIQSMSRRLLEDLPPVNYNVFVYLISFFREVLLYRKQNRLTAAKLAGVLCEHCSPTPPSLLMESSVVQRRAGMKIIMMHLLETSSI